MSCFLQTPQHLASRALQKRRCHSRCCYETNGNLSGGQSLLAFSSLSYSKTVVCCKTKHLHPDRKSYAANTGACYLKWAQIYYLYSELNLLQLLISGLIFHPHYKVFISQIYISIQLEPNLSKLSCTNLSSFAGSHDRGRTTVWKCLCKQNVAVWFWKTWVINSKSKNLE